MVTDNLAYAWWTAALYDLPGIEMCCVKSWQVADAAEKSAS
jgi:hypothetical protein